MLSVLRPVASTVICSVKNTVERTYVFAFQGRVEFIFSCRTILNTLVRL